MAKDIQVGSELFDMHDYDCDGIINTGHRKFGVLEVVPNSWQHVYVDGSSQIVQRIIEEAGGGSPYLNKTLVALEELEGAGEVKAIYSMDNKRFGIITLERR
jgi:hypothetical protein